MDSNDQGKFGVIYLYLEKSVKKGGEDKNVTLVDRL